MTYSGKANGGTRSLLLNVQAAQTWLKQAIQAGTTRVTETRAMKRIGDDSANRHGGPDSPHHELHESGLVGVRTNRHRHVNRA
jgi:hypothetical protein